MTGALEHRDEDSADIAVVTCDQDSPHRRPKNGRGAADLPPTRVKDGLASRCDVYGTGSARGEATRDTRSRARMKVYKSVGAVDVYSPARVATIVAGAATLLAGAGFVGGLAAGGDSGSSSS